MREIRVSSALTVYYDGQFWAGTFERIENGKLSACHMVFGAEPSNEEIEELICKQWNRLRFTEPVRGAETPKAAANPKRRQREAARELRQKGPSTKAQQALAEEREVTAQERKTEVRERREQLKQQRFEQRQKKRKQKHCGK